MRTSTIVLAHALLLVLAGCNVDNGPNPSNEPKAALPPEPASLPITRDEVLEPREPTGNVVVGDYGASEGTFRVFGIEPGDAVHPRSVILADTRTWSTRAYAEGERVGRGMRVAHVGEDDATLETTRGDLLVRAGADVKLRIVQHRLDVVARPLGKHRFALDQAAAQAATSVLPTFEMHELYGGNVAKLGPVAKGSRFAEADLREGDLIAALDGVPATEATVADVNRALAEGRASVQIRVIRAGIPLERTYDRTTR